MVVATAEEEVDEIKETEGLKKVGVDEADC